MDVAAHPPVNDQASLAERHQMLRQGRLPAAKDRFQVTHTRFPLPDRQQYLQAGWLPNDLEEVCKFVKGGYIRLHEYII